MRIILMLLCFLSSSAQIFCQSPVDQLRIDSMLVKTPALPSSVSKDTYQNISPEVSREAEYILKKHKKLKMNFWDKIERSWIILDGEGQLVFFVKVSRPRPYRYYYWRLIQLENKIRLVEKTQNALIYLPALDKSINENEKNDPELRRILLIFINSKNTFAID